MKYTMSNPCNECPFRRDRAGFLHRSRAQDIADGLLALGEKCHPFVCHKTLNRTDIDEQHCAGALILLEKTGRPHLAMILGRQLREYVGSPNVDHPHVFDSMKEFVEHHARKLPGDSRTKGMRLAWPNRYWKPDPPEIVVEREELPDEPQWRPVGKP